MPFVINYFYFGAEKIIMTKVFSSEIIFYEICKIVKTMESQGVI